MQPKYSSSFLIPVALTLAFAVSSGAATPKENRVLTYPAPANATLNDDFDVRVRTPDGQWQELSEYLVQVKAVQSMTSETVEAASMAAFDFEGKVEISVTSNQGPIESAKIRPLSRGIQPNVAGNRLSFTIHQPEDLSVEINGDIFHNLHLFARAIPEAAPDPETPGVIYFGPGFHELPKGELKVPSNTRVYLAGGAVVRGCIRVENEENVVIDGRGFIEQNHRDMSNNVRIVRSRNVRVDGIFSSNVTIAESRDVTVSDVKSISYDRWGDGMNVFCSHGVVIDRVFNRNSDDCFTVYGTRNKFSGDASNITLKNSTLWADIAHPILIGTHGNPSKPDTLENITISNIDILDHMERQIDYQGCMAINAGDSNLVRNVRFENIRVEDFRKGQLVNLRVFFNKYYNKAPGRGIENVTFDHITYNGSRANTSIIAGYDSERPIRNVVFNNLVINGTVISENMADVPKWFKTSDMANMFVGEHVDGLRLLAEPVANGD